MKITFELYDKLYFSLTSKLLIVGVVLSLIAWLVLISLSSNPVYEYLQLYAFGFFLAIVIFLIIYWVRSILFRKFIPTGTLEFYEDGININNNKSSISIIKRDIVKLTVYVQSYDGETVPDFASGLYTQEGIDNRLFIRTNDLYKSYKFYINNRAQLIYLQKLLKTWKFNDNIDIRFTNRNSEDCFKVVV